MHSPGGSQEEELIVNGEEDIFNVKNIPIVISVETQSLLESEEQDLEETLKSAIAPAPVPNLFASAIRKRPSKTLQTSALPKQTSEPYEISQRLPYDYVVRLKPEVSYKMPQNLDAMGNSVTEFIKSFLPSTTECNAVRSEISSVLRTPCIYHVDTETTSSESLSTTKKAGSLEPVTQKYKKSFKIRIYRNPDGTVTEEKKIVEQSSTSNKGNINISDLYTSDEDETKFDDKYFNSLFKDIPDELDEDDLDFFVKNENQIYRPSSSRKTKSEKIHTSEPIANLQLKTSISSRVVSSNAENASNVNNLNVSYIHSDVKLSHPVKEEPKESDKEIEPKITDKVSKISSDAASLARKSKSERINDSAPMADLQLKTSISGKIISSKAENTNYDDLAVVSHIRSDIKPNRSVKEPTKEREKEIYSEIIDQVSKASSTIRSISTDKKQNVVTRSTSTDEISIKNEKTNTDFKFVQLDIIDTGKNIELKREIRREFDKLITKIGKKPSQKDFGKFCNIMYDKYGIQLMETQDDTEDRKKQLEQKRNNIEEIELKTLKDLGKEEQILQEILNRITLKTKDNVNEKKISNEVSSSKREPKSNDANLSVTGSLEQYGKKLLNTVEYVKEGVKNIFSRENSKFSAETAKGDKYATNEPDNTKIKEKQVFGGTDIDKEEYKGADVKSQGIKILDSSQSEDSIIKAVETFNKRGVQIWDSEDDPKGVVQSAITKFNKELRRPEHTTDNSSRKTEDTKTKYNKKQTKAKEVEEKPTFVIKEIEIIDQQNSKLIAPESTVQKDLRAFRSSSHPDKTTTDSDVTTKSERIAKEQMVTADNTKKEVVVLNDMLTANKEKHSEIRNLRSEPDKKSVSLPESEFCTESHLKTKIKRIKEKGREDKFELHSVYKEVSTSSQVSEISKIPSKQSSSTRKHAIVSVITQRECKDGSTIDLNVVKAESEECIRKIIICKKCLMALCGYIPSKIVEETEMSADCQLCRLKEKQKGALTFPNSNSSIIVEEASSFCYSSDEEGQVCVTPVLGYEKCYDKETWSDKYPCGRPKEDEKLVLFREDSDNKLEKDKEKITVTKLPVIPSSCTFGTNTHKVNDDVTRFVMTSSSGTFGSNIPDKPKVSNLLTESPAATIPNAAIAPTVATVSTEQNFAEILATSLKRLLGLEQNKIELPCASEELYDSYESEIFNVPRSPVCTREAATNTKTSTRYDVRCLRDFPPFKKGPKRDSESSKCGNSDMILDISRIKDFYLRTQSSNSLNNTVSKNKNICTKTENTKNDICKKKKR